MRPLGVWRATGVGTAEYRIGRGNIACGGECTTIGPDNQEGITHLKNEVIVRFGVIKQTHECTHYGIRIGSACLDREGWRNGRRG